jgi:hypothetical protein
LIHHILYLECFEDLRLESLEGILVGGACYCWEEWSQPGKHDVKDFSGQIKNS